MRGLGGLVKLVGRVGGPLEEGGFSDWSDGSDWSEILTKHGGCHKKNPAPLGGGAGWSYFFSAGLRLRFRA